MCKAICYSRNQGKLASVSTGVSTASPGEQYSMTMYVYLNAYALAYFFHCMGIQLGPGCSANRDILQVGLTPILTLERELWSNSFEVQLRILLQAPSHLWSHGLSVQSPHTPHISIVPVTLRPLTDFTDWTQSFLHMQAPSSFLWLFTLFHLTYPITSGSFSPQAESVNLQGRNNNPLLAEGYPADTNILLIVSWHAPLAKLCFSSDPQMIIFLAWVLVFPCSTTFCNITRHMHPVFSWLEQISVFMYLPEMDRLPPLAVLGLTTVLGIPEYQGGRHSWAHSRAQQAMKPILQDLRQP